MPEPYTIRRASPNDLSALLALVPELTDFEVPERRNPDDLWTGDAALMQAAITEESDTTGEKSNGDGASAGAPAVSAAELAERSRRSLSLMPLGMSAFLALFSRGEVTVPNPVVTREAAMAKLYATDRAQEVIDKAVQIHGGDGVRKGHIVESLYREIRALRIYEGASDVQKIIIARQTLG